MYTVCPRILVPFYIVSYNIKWVMTSWTYSIQTLIMQQFKLAIKLTFKDFKKINSYDMLIVP